jgi:hypothetical protein
MHAGDSEKSVSKNNELKYRRMMQIPAEKLFFFAFSSHFFDWCFLSPFDNAGSGAATGL